jgi:hypothetical protein
MEGIPVCRICKDPVWSYICPECLAKDIRNWLPQRLRARFAAFSQAFVEHFSGHGQNPRINCIKCGARSPANVCPFCYVTEMHEWLAENGEPGMAHVLAGMLPSGRGRSGRGHDSWNGIEPITDTRGEQYDEGMCEECGEFSEELEHVNGEWVCRSCKNWQ